MSGRVLGVRGCGLIAAIIGRLRTSAPASGLFADVGPSGVSAVPMFKIYVGNLDPRVKIEQVRELFSPFMTIEDAVLVSDSKTGKAKGFAIVMVRDPEIGRAAVKATQGKRLLGKTLTINEVMKKGQAAAKAAKETRQGPFGPHFNRQGGGRAGAIRGGPRRGINRGPRGTSFGSGPAGAGPGSGPSLGPGAGPGPSGFGGSGSGRSFGTGPGSSGSGYGAPRPGASGFGSSSGAPRVPRPPFGSDSSPGSRPPLRHEGEERRGGDSGGMDSGDRPSRPTK
jgi:hypothetical protein